ncbi:hypothetical protein [Dongshaea marina]|uniref:hypothetical protein n=1 Tax=Dongshaea marina TaxID=2047966 RepID=UPI001F48F6AD|nr:hypothetical protein [Dongshaea marina]
MALTIQTYIAGEWLDTASLQIDDPGAGRAGEIKMAYLKSYALKFYGEYGYEAVSLNRPVELMVTYSKSHWFAFLDDIMPSGAARKYWISHLGLSGLTSDQQDFALLEKGTIAPVGNLRIKESLPMLPEGSTLTTRRFPELDVIERDSHFLEYAQSMGAISGGATGAGGKPQNFCCEEMMLVRSGSIHSKMSQQILIPTIS